jgi:transposase-like protein
MISSPKYRTFSKAGMTLICPGCEQTDTYQIGQFDRDKWAMHRGNYWCKDCRAKFHAVYLPSAPAEPEDEIDALLRMV